MARRPSAAQRGRRSRHSVSRMMIEKSARNEAKIISASAASAKNSPASSAFFRPRAKGRPSRSVLRR